MHNTLHILLKASEEAEINILWVIACLLWKWRKIPSEITQIFGYFDLLWGIEQNKKLTSIVKGKTKLFT